MSGYAVGFIVGLACGFAIGRKQKPWSELTDKEKAIIIGLTIVLVVLVLLTLFGVIF